MPEAAWIILGVVLAGAMVLVSLRWLAAASARAQARVRALVAGEEVVMESRLANFVGLASRGSRQLRGTGALVLTEHRLAFVMWAPRREVVIDRAAITGAELSHRHAGLARSPRMLKVRFTGPDGVEDSAAWSVADAGAWLAAVTPAGGDGG